ncbi:MAG: uroporphyrinogen decarboxylase family protein [Acetivibrionales bacterium]|jgi:uroporphyrinogen decarboxylase
MTSRELVKKTLEFQNFTGVIPRDLWTLPWAEIYYKKELAQIFADYRPDIVQVPDTHKQYALKPIGYGSVYELGNYMDEWGVVWKNMQHGLVGEVKEPIVSPEDEEWVDVSRIHFPEELLTLDVERVNGFCASTDQFVLSSDLVRPFERMQFLRGTENLLIDLALGRKSMLAMLDRIHDFNCRLLKLWCQTDVDGLFVMDDWGTQKALIINPTLWVKIFKPLYRDYCDIAHRYGKKLFFHSDGNTLDIIPHLIDIGVDAANLQIFCIGIRNIVQFKGKITFWGEIDRQYLLAHGTPEEIDNAVKEVHAAIWDKGGAIAQCEFGAGAKPENVRQVFHSWSELASKDSR